MSHDLEMNALLERAARLQEDMTAALKRADNAILLSERALAQIEAAPPTDFRNR